jgi:hypothetical protein
MDAELTSLRERKAALHKEMTQLRENHDRQIKAIWKELAVLSTEGKDLCKITHNGCNMVPDGNYAYADLVCTRCGAVKTR